MISGMKRIAAVLGLCSLSLQLATAEPLSGEFDIEVVNAPVYDLSGPWNFSHNLIGTGGAPTPLTFGIPLDITPSGRLFAEGTTFVGIGSDYVAASFRARGSSSGGGTRSNRMTLTVTMTGEDTITGIQAVRFKITTTYSLEVAADGVTVVGKASGTASLGKLGKSSFRVKDFAMAMPRDTNGEWMAHLNLVALNKISGSGYIQLPPASAIYLPNEIKGSYSKKTDASKLSLTGVREGKGNKVQISATTTNLISINGVILGQRVKE
jgi:hypothetical protein